MNWVETLAEYYRLSRTGETQHWLCRRWLLQGRRVWPICGSCWSRPRHGGGEQSAGVAGVISRDQPKAIAAQRNSSSARQISSSTTTILPSLLPMRFVATLPSLLAEIPPAGEEDEEKRH